MALHKAYAIHHTLALTLVVLEGLRQTLEWHMQLGGDQIIEEYTAAYDVTLSSATRIYREEFTGKPDDEITPEMFAEAKRIYEQAADFNYSMSYRPETEGTFSRIIRNQIKMEPNVKFPSAQTPQRVKTTKLPVRQTWENRHQWMRG